jgi:hypothetical protein
LRAAPSSFEKEELFMRRVSSFVALIAVAAASAGIAIAAQSPGSPMMSTAKTFKIGAANNGICSGPVRQCGTITFTPAGEKTRVVIAITGEPAGAIEPSHIHKGVCGHPGAVIYPLTDVVAGHSTTVVNAPISKIVVSGDSVNIHKSAAQLNQYMACGNLGMAM